MAKCNNHQVIVTIALQYIIPRTLRDRAGSWHWSVDGLKT